jgi:hypothetical protein
VAGATSFLVESATGLPRRERKSAIGAGRAPDRERLFSQIESVDHVFVTVRGRSLQIIEQFPAAGDHLQQSPPGRMIFDVILKMVRELIDSLGKERDLNIRTASVFGMHPERLNFLSIGHITIEGWEYAARCRIGK